MYNQFNMFQTLLKCFLILNFGLLICFSCCPKKFKTGDLSYNLCYIQFDKQTNATEFWLKPGNRFESVQAIRNCEGNLNATVMEGYEFGKDTFRTDHWNHIFLNFTSAVSLHNVSVYKIDTYINCHLQSKVISSCSRLGDFYFGLQGPAEVSLENQQGTSNGMRTDTCETDQKVGSSYVLLIIASTIILLGIILAAVGIVQYRKAKNVREELKKQAESIIQNKKDSRASSGVYENPSLNKVGENTQDEEYDYYEPEILEHQSSVKVQSGETVRYANATRW